MWRRGAAQEIRGDRPTPRKNPGNERTKENATLCTWRAPKPVPVQIGNKSWGKSCLSTKLPQSCFVQHDSVRLLRQTEERPLRSHPAKGRTWRRTRSARSSRYLVERCGVDVDDVVHAFVPLHVAVLHYQIDTMCEEKRSALDLAVHCGYDDVVAVLLERVKLLKVQMLRSFQIQLFCCFWKKCQ
jgi:hypothetical protein